MHASSFASSDTSPAAVASLTGRRSSTSSGLRVRIEGADYNGGRFSNSGHFCGTRLNAAMS